MQQTQTILLRGGLDLISPQVAMPDGRVIAALNYEPDDTGYTSTGGYTKYDGKSSSAAAVPGSGPVCVVTYQGAVLAFRDDAGGGGASMYKSTVTGWVQQTFGHTLDFTAGTTEFAEGELLTGGTSGATATIERVVLEAGAWNGSAAGFLVLSGVTGTFQGAETITSASGSATASGAQVQIALFPGGAYEFVIHNFYGPAVPARLYFANGMGNAFEWDGEVLAPIKTGIDTGGAPDVLLTAGGPPDKVLTADGGDIIVAENELDNPAYIDVFRNHLYLGYAVGAAVFSEPGVPLQYRTIGGAGTFGFGEQMTGMQTVATAVIMTGRDRISYVAGNDVDDFQLLEITDNAGAMPRTLQVAGESPIYLDDGGLRTLSAAASYGDFRSATLTRLVEPLIRQKRLGGVVPTASLIVRGKDQYRLYWGDGSGVVLYLGRKYPEVLPFKLPTAFFSAWAGELQPGEGDRLFAGAASGGFVYELDKGTSFDGASIDTYLRLAFNNLGAPTQRKAFHKYTADVVCEDAITVGVRFDIDYARSDDYRPAQVNEAASAGAPIVTTAAYGSVDWTEPVQGEVSHYLYGIGRNVAVTHITSSSTKRQHTFPASTINFAPRGLAR